LNKRLRKVLEDENMKLIVNGKESNLEEGLTISQLLIEQEVKMPEMVSVELNGKILKRSEFESTALNEGDKVEFLYFMGGGNVIN
jgi:sulfur carrier protein